MYRTAMIISAAKVLSAWSLLVFCDMEGMVYKLVNTFVFGSRDRDNRNA
jgi:hypothetical protein